MQSEATGERLGRLREKHAEGLFLWELENGFELSPRASELVFATANNILVDHRRAERGKEWIVGVEVGQSAGKSIRDAKKRDVHELRQAGCEVQTRGYYEGIGRSISHKARIVELYLR